MTILVLEDKGSSKRLRVLVCAYACEPDRGSDPGVGWNWVKQIARFNEVWVITRANNRQNIEQYIAKYPMEGVHFCYFDYPYWVRFWKKGERGIHFYYYLWMIGAYVVGRRLHGRIGFDLAHHITFPVDWMPSFMCLLPVPFVWGPIGGGVHTFPRHFLKEMGIRNLSHEIVRYLYQNWGFYLDPFVRLTRKRAAKILASTQGCADSLPKGLSNKIAVISRIGIAEEDKFEVDRRRRDNMFRVFSTGRLVPWKGFSLAIRAFADFLKQCPNATLVIGGKGPDRHRLDALVKELNVSDNVHLLGQIPSRQEVFEQMGLADVVLLPSLRDGPLVTMLEAMYAGKPVVCIDAGGASDMITEECGFKVRGANPEQLICRITDALLLLASDENLRNRIGAAAKTRVASHYDWDRKGELLNSVYKSLAGQV